MYLLGIDVGSSSVKASLVNAENGKCVASDFSPKVEMQITALKSGWAEQHPDSWWNNFKAALKNILSESGVNSSDIKAIGISYQMHEEKIQQADRFSAYRWQSGLYAGVIRNCRCHHFCMVSGTRGWTSRC